MSRPSIIALVVVAVILIVTVALAGMNTEVPTRAIEAPVTLTPAGNAAAQP